MYQLQKFLKNTYHFNSENIKNPEEAKKAYEAKKQLQKF
jgi:hypothetical protein